MNITKMNINVENLAKHVHAINEVQAIAKANIDFILPQLEKYIGKKIYLANGATAKSYTIEFKRIEPKKYKDEYAILQNLYISNSGSSLWLKVSCSFKRDNNSCFYKDEAVWIGELEENGQVLKSLRTEPYTPNEYKTDEIVDLLEEREMLENQLRSVKSKLRDFSNF